jgi:hypothetical protein
MTKFKDCNPGVKSMYTRARDVKRTKGTEPEDMQPFYDALKQVKQTNQHPASAIFNVDKMGFAIGNVHWRKGMIYWDAIASAAGKCAHALQAKQARGKWVTSIECITARARPSNLLSYSKARASIRHGC